jgi:hypothetical protein
MRPRDDLDLLVVYSEVGLSVDIVFVTYHK